MDKTIKILHLEDTASDAELIEHGLKKGGLDFVYHLVETKEAFLNELEVFKPDIILSDHMLPSFSSVEALSIVKSHSIRIPFILISGRVPEEFMVSMIKEGAADYLVKDRLQRLPGAIVNAIEKARAEEEREKHFKEIERKERRFRALIENSNEAIILCDENLNISYSSPSVMGVTGRSSEEMKNSSLAEHIHPEDSLILKTLHAKTLAFSAKPFRAVFRSMHSEGNYIWVDFTFTNLLNDENVKALVANFRDVTASKKTREYVLNREKHFRALVENISDGIVLTSEDGLMLYNSPSVKKITGFEPDELTGKNIFDYFHPVDVKRAKNHLKKIFLEAGTVQHNSFRIKHQNGTYITVEGTLTNLLEEESVKALVINYRDVTDKRLSEQLVQKSEANLRTILENTDTAYVLLDHKAKVISFNGPAAQLFKEKTNMEIAVGMFYLDYVPLERIKEVTVVIEEVLKSGNRISYETKYLSPEGSEKWLTVNMNPIFDNKNRTTGLIIGATNITEMKVSENMLKKSEGYLRTMFDSTPVSYIFTDTEFNIVAFNKVAENIFNKECNISLQVGKKITLCLPEDRRGEAHQRCKSVLNKEKLNYEINFVQPDNSLNWYDVNILPIEDENNALFGLLITSENITERKNAEIERDKMTSLIVQRNKDLEQFAYIISHNLRSPVANITGLITIILENPDLDQKELEKCLNGLALSVKKVDEVIIDLNYILQIRREINENKQLVSFSEIVNNITATISNLIEKDNISIVTDFNSAPEFFTIKSYLYSIFYNLISNSIKYRSVKEKTVITVKSIKVAEKILVSFEDNGLGIDMALHGNKIFGLYKKFHTHVEGKGIGLYLVKTQAELLGGTISVQSEVNKGTKFVIEFETT